MLSNQQLKHMDAVRRNTNSVADTTEDYTNQYNPLPSCTTTSQRCIYEYNKDVFCSLKHTIGSTYMHQAAACSLSLLVWMDMWQDKSVRLVFPSLLQNPSRSNSANITQHGKMTNDRVTVHENRWIHVQCWEKTTTYQPSNRCGQSVHPPDGTRLDPVDHTVRGGKKKKENEGTLVRKWKDWAIDETEGTNKEPT